MIGGRVTTTTYVQVVRALRHPKTSSKRIEKLFDEEGWCFRLDDNLTERFKSHDNTPSWIKEMLEPDSHLSCEDMCYGISLMKFI